MNRAAALLLLVASASSAEVVNVERVALVIAHKNGGAGRAVLTHAESDARAFASVLRELGGVADNDIVMVIDEDRHAVESKLASLSHDIAVRKAAGKRTELVVYYSGHADEQGLLFSRELLPWETLRAHVDSTSADIKLVVLDACSSGAALRSKGGRRRPPLQVDASLAPRGQAYLTSSTAEEASQESDRLGGSFFTHAIVTGLRGAADTSGDGQVTLDEVYRFAYHETLARTQLTYGGAQHASFDVNLTGSGELVLTDLRDKTGRLVLADDIAGRVYVRDSGERRLIAEVTKLKGAQMPLVLPPGGYDVVVVETTMSGAQAKKASARVTSQGVVVDVGSFVGVSLEEVIPRGLLPLTYFPINLGFVSPLEVNSYADRVENNLALTLLFGRTARLYGTGLSLGGNLVDERMVGAVFGLGFNGTLGPATGGMFGTANVALSDMTGVQGGLLFNMGAAQTTGAAWAVANVHRAFTGAQLGLVNIAGDVTGAQIGVVNIARHVTGTQFGVVNIAKSSAIPVGVASIIGDGQLGLGLLTSDLSLLGLEARAGGRYVFTQVRAGATPLLAQPKAGATSDSLWMPVVTAGLGGTIPVNDWLFVDVDAGVGAAGLTPLVSTGARLRVKPVPMLSLFAGPELRVVPAGALSVQPWALDAGDVTLWPGLVLGLSL